MNFVQLNESKLKSGDMIEKGTPLGYTSDNYSNEYLPPHISLKATLSQKDIETTYLNPASLIPISESFFPNNAKNNISITRDRAKYLGPSLSVSYNKPIKIVRGWKQYLFERRRVGWS